MSLAWLSVQMSISFFIFFSTSSRRKKEQILTKQKVEILMLQNTSNSSTSSNSAFKLKGKHKLDAIFCTPLSDSLVDT